MSSEEISLIAGDKFIQKFVFSIIQIIRARNFEYGKRHVIHADLVPRISERVMHASLGEGTTRGRGGLERVEVAPVVSLNKTADGLGAPGVRRPARMGPPVRRMMPPAPRMASPPTIVAPPTAPHDAPTGLSQDYGKIMPLLNDPSVSVIECHGAGKPVMVIRAGQRQVTKIVLSAEDIKNVLDKVSDAAHIPLLDGVFRAAVDNFSINAVISEIVGSRFVVKKSQGGISLGRVPS